MTRHASSPLHRARPALAAIVALTLGGCGGATSAPSPAVKRLDSEARPIGPGPRYQPKVTGHPAGGCRRRLGRRFAAHIEVFARDRVVILPAGIGIRGAHTLDGRVIAARCEGPIVTLDPTGVVLVGPSRTATLGELFGAWGLPLSRTRLAGFAASPGAAVRIYVGGRRVRAAPGDIAVTRHAEIVLEVGPYVPPHTSYTFPPEPPDLASR